jgi:hypothetical protein
VIESEEYIYNTALFAGAKFPELVVAQWTLESARGTKVSGKNNIAGLKGPGKKKTTTEYINNKPVLIQDSFLDFDSVENCIKYLVDRWYKDFDGYKGVNNAASAELAAKMLVSEGYATDPNYAEKLIRLMSQQSRDASLIDAVKYFSGKPQEVKAFQDLQNSLTPEQRKLFTDAWRLKAAKPSSQPAQPGSKSPLSVPYFWQRNSKGSQGGRMCQSSAIAMRIEQIDPKIVGDDDSYLSVVNRYGDTVSQSAHQKALESLGLTAQFRQDGTEKLLCSLLDRGIAVPIGILHKGNIAKPTGGGHWITLIGYDEKFFHVHDPFGELDLINGGYPNAGPEDGKNVRYTRANLMKRWLIASKADGWLWIIEK